MTAALGAGSRTTCPGSSVRSSAYERRYPAVEPVVRVPRPAQGDGREDGGGGGCCGWPAARLVAVGALAGYDALGFQRAAGLRARAATAPRRRSRGGGPTCSNGTRRWPSSGRAGPPGPEQEGRVAGQGGRHPGRQRHRGRRPARPARRPQGPGAPARPGDPRRSRRRRSRSGTTDAGRPSQGEARSLAAIDDPATALAAIDAFLREFPDTPRRAEALEAGPVAQAGAERPPVRPAIGSSSTTWSAPSRCPTSRCPT